LLWKANAATHTTKANEGGGRPTAITYVPDAVPDGAGTENLTPLGVAGQAVYLALAPALRRLGSVRGGSGAAADGR